MQNSSDTQSFDDSLDELLQAAGYQNLEALQGEDAVKVHAELLRANEMLGLVDEPPSLEVIGRLVGNKPVQEITEEAPTEQVIGQAIPLSDGFIKKHEIDLASLPSVSGTRREKAPVARERVQLPAKKQAEANEPEPVAKQGTFEKERVKSMEDFRANGSVVAPLHPEKEHDVTKSALKETNEGVDPDSRRYVRGVLHTDASRVTAGAVGLIFTQLLLLLSFAPLLLTLVDKEKFGWAVFSPLLLIVALAVYLFVARKAYCPVCRQKQFSPKACHKHVKAHTAPLLGHMLPTALHVLSFKWFRCIFCGTAIRLKQ